MDCRKMTETLTKKDKSPASRTEISSRNLGKKKLGAVIFGCNHETMHECLSEQLFGLPACHYSYIQNIEPGLPLFLFNYSDRKLHGIFEATTQGGLNIKPYAYPPQVKFIIRMLCHPLSEDQFRPIIAANYYAPKLFWFELDHKQTKKLISLFSSTPISETFYLPQKTSNLSNPLPSTSAAKSYFQWFYANIDVAPSSLISPQSREIELDQTQSKKSIDLFPSEIFSLPQRTSILSKAPPTIYASTSECNSHFEGFDSNIGLKIRSSLFNVSTTDASLDDSIFIVGGFDGSSWISTMNCYHPSKDIMESLPGMTSLRLRFSTSVLNDEIYVLGGVKGETRYDTVESYHPEKHQWVKRPSLTREKEGLAALSLNNRIFALGGENGDEYFSEVEMFDSEVGRWIPTPSMKSERVSFGAGELNGILYAVGGFDGNKYLKSAEMFDPRENSWRKIASLSTKRFSHCLVVFNEKLYAVGGFTGNNVLSTIEVFDPRRGSWMMTKSLNKSRAYAGSAVIGDAIYVFGGVNNGNIYLDMVECYNDENRGWEVTNLNEFGKRCSFSSVVL